MFKLKKSNLKKIYSWIMFAELLQQGKFLTRDITTAVENECNREACKQNDDRY